MPVESGEDLQKAYEKARAELAAAIQKKRAVDKNLSTLENNLYNFEGSYLADTSTSGGNIITGFENYLKTATTGRRKGEQNIDNDRLFSNSSVTVLRALELSGEDLVQPPSPPMNTVSLGPPPSTMSEMRRDGGRLGRGQRKRTEDPEFLPPPSVASSNRPGRPAKRQKISNDD